DGSDRPEPSTLLADDALDLDIDRRLDPQVLEDGNGSDGGGQAALHVGRPATQNPPVADLATVRVDHPSGPVARWHDVDVPVEGHDRARSSDGPATKHVRAELEVLLGLP